MQVPMPNYSFLLMKIVFISFSSKTADLRQIQLRIFALFTFRVALHTIEHTYELATVSIMN
jgi:hypothetical protein